VRENLALHASKKPLPAGLSLPTSGNAAVVGKSERDAHSVRVLSLLTPCYYGEQYGRVDL
jgi:hypothetical protein